MESYGSAILSGELPAIGERPTCFLCGLLEQRSRQSDVLALHCVMDHPMELAKPVCLIGNRDLRDFPPESFAGGFE